LRPSGPRAAVGANFTTLADANLTPASNRNVAGAIFTTAGVATMAPRPGSTQVGRTSPPSAAAKQRAGMLSAEQLDAGRGCRLQRGSHAHARCQNDQSRITLERHVLHTLTCSGCGRTRASGLRRCRHGSLRFLRHGSTPARCSRESARVRGFQPELRRRIVTIDMNVRRLRCVMAREIEPVRAFPEHSGHVTALVIGTCFAFDEQVSISARSGGDSIAERAGSSSV